MENNKIYLQNMQMKKIIINADDFGHSKENNEAIKQGFLSGVITSASLIANMDGFEDAVHQVNNYIPNIDLGFHFNIVEGKSLTNCNLLCDKDGYFNNSYINLILKSADKNFTEQLEQEFRAQIEKVLTYHKISHIDSHMHTHAIPNIFKMILKLSKEYNIPFIRTQKEVPYIVLKKSFSVNYAINIIKNILLNYYTQINVKELKKTEIKTNDYFIGVLYTGNMDESTIINGLRKIKHNNSVTEIIFHPNYNKAKQNNYKEYLITQNPKFKDTLINSGFILCDYTELLVR